MRRTTVLFVCTNNSARSQMAEGLLNALHGDRYEAFSAGTEPTAVNPLAAKAMAEMGIDISGHSSKGVEEFLDRDIDVVVTVCDRAGESCPIFPGGRRRIHRSFRDPAAVRGTDVERLRAFIEVREEIRRWLEMEFEERALVVDTSSERTGHNVQHDDRGGA
ncbi:MAG: arsenate reductase ArsC [Thermoplasmata archaeon]|nr:arsenate reductase ArsC [Thermoplasmata archaeon]